MHLPHTLLTVLAAAILWGAAVAVAPAPPATVEEAPAFALPGSAFGSLIARTVRASLFGAKVCTDPCCAPSASPSPAPPSGAGVFSGRRLRSASSDQAAPSTGAIAHGAMGHSNIPKFSTSPLDWAAASLNALDQRRAQGVAGRRQLSVAHIQYVEASRGWRLRLAYNLDPGDPVLYELLHFHLVTTPQGKSTALERSRLLGQKALAHAQSSQAGMADSLTGVGAAIDVFNEASLAVQPRTLPKDEVMPIWDSIAFCQQRFRETRAAAEREGWWENIPASRRTEIDSHARNLDNLIVKIRDHLTTKGYLVNHQ